MKIARLARPEIRSLRPYEAAAQVDGTIRLNANEVPWTSDADRYRRPLNRYPEVRPAGLRNLLAERYGCAARELLVTRGTSEAIDLLVRVFCRAGVDNVVTTSPTFSMYRHYARIQGAECREVAADRDTGFAFDVDALVEACDANTRLVFICSPNNPTGTTIPRDRLVELLERLGNRSAIVVDEAYIEFSAEPSTIPLRGRHPNLLVLRTLSKALAFAGARCGAVIGPAEAIDLLNAVQAPYALATPVVECIENALQTASLSESEAWLREIIDERERLVERVATFSFVRRVWPSAANFFLVEVDDAPALMRQSADDKILLRYLDGELANCVRITVGTRAENGRLLETFAALENRTDD